MIYRFLKKIAFSCLFLSLQSCQIASIVTAQVEGELNFEPRNDWDYAARVAPPRLIQQVRDENISPSWIGDPKRFQIIKVAALGQRSPLYFIFPAIGCPETGCRDDLRPLCNVSGACTYLAYIEEGGKYRKVFDRLFWTQGEGDFFQVSQQFKDGLPQCLELLGYDDFAWRDGLPPHQETQQFVSRYCYDTQKQEYILDRLYLVSAPAKK